MKRKPRQTRNERRNLAIYQHMEKELVGDAAHQALLAAVDVGTRVGQFAAKATAQQANQMLAEYAVSFPSHMKFLQDVVRTPRTFRTLGPAVHTVTQMHLDLEFMPRLPPPLGVEVAVIKPRDLRGVRSKGISFDEVQKYCEKDAELTAGLHALLRRASQRVNAEDESTRKANPK